MGGHTLALKETLNGRGGKADFDRAPDQAVRDTVLMAVDVDVAGWPRAIVHVHLCGLPFGEFVVMCGQWPHRRAINGREDAGPAAIELFEWPVVQVRQQRTDGAIEFGQREEPMIAQPRQNPALGQQNALLGGCLLASHQLPVM